MEREKRKGSGIRNEKKKEDEVLWLDKLSKKELGQLACELASKIFMKHKSRGIIDKILGYVFPYKDEDDIFCEYVATAWEEMLKLDSKRGNIDTKLRLMSILEIKLKRVFTENINIGAKYIERLVSINGKYKNVREKSYYLNRKLYKNNETISYRKVEYIDDIKTKYFGDEEIDPWERLNFALGGEGYLLQSNEDKQDIFIEKEEKENRESVIDEIYNLLSVIKNKQGG